MMKLSALSFGKILFISASLATSSLPAASVTSDPVGVMFYNFPTTSDTNIGVGLARPSAFEGRIASVDLINSTVTFQGNPGWATDQFTATAEQYYLYIKSGEEEGMIVTVTGNAADSVTVFVDTGDRLDRLVVGEVASIVPYWTPRTFLGDALSNGAQFRFYRDRAPIYNQIVSEIYTYQDGEWYVDGTSDIASDRPLFPGECFVVRNTGSQTDVTAHGTVPMASVRIVMRSNGRPLILKDQRISFFTPVRFPIRNLLPVMESDTILTFNMTSSGYNKGNAIGIMYFWNDWLQIANFLPISQNFSIEAGHGYIYQGLQNMFEDTTVLTMPLSYLD